MPAAAPAVRSPKRSHYPKGERGDAVFFIASGAVEVILPERRVRLGSGEFFGEMALLSGRLRQADVVALTFCQMLVLRRTDFERFMKANPEARATIDRVAEARQAMNTSERTKSSELDDLTLSRSDGHGFTNRCADLNGFFTPLSRSTAHGTIGRGRSNSFFGAAVCRSL